MTFQNWIAILVVGAITIFLLYLLWAIVRFAIIAPMRLRGAERRLRKPQPQGVEKKWGVKLPPVLAQLYREHPIIEKTEFYLAAEPSNPDGLLYIYSFTSLTVLDITEEKKVSRVPGIPIATENKGTYYLPKSALTGGGPVPVMLRFGKKDKQVAGSVEQFFGYPVTEPSEEVDVE